MKISDNQRFYLVSVATALTTVIIAVGGKMDFIGTVFAAIVAAVAVAVLMFVFTKLIRKNVGATIIYETQIARVIFWNEEIFRKVSTQTFIERRFTVRTIDNMIFTNVNVVKSDKIKRSNFSCKVINNEDELIIIIDDLPPRSFVEFQIQTAAKNSESVLLKSELTNCPKAIIKDALEVDYWRPQKLYLPTKSSEELRLYLTCGIKNWSFSKSENMRKEKTLNWICSFAAIIGEVVALVMLTIYLCGYAVNPNLTTWSVAFVIVGIIEVKRAKDMPLFVKKYVSDS